MASQLYPTATIAKLLLLTPQRVNQLCKEGVLTKADVNSFELAPTIQSYVKYLQDRIEGRTDQKSESARLTKLRADKAEKELAQINSELIKSDLAMMAWGTVIQNIRTKLISIPNKAAPLVVGLKSPAEIDSLLKKMVYEILNELANPDLKEINKKLLQEDRDRKKKHIK
jgi:phage terminase Nu1 subunit (DNA packaging protein)